MNFDTGTWWLIGILLTALIAICSYFIKRSMDNIEQIKKDYTPRAVHDKDCDKIREDITKITENYLTKEDFFREQAKTDRKLDKIIDILLKKGDAK